MDTKRDQTTVDFFADDIREISKKTQKLIKKSIGLFAEGEFDEVRDLLEDSKVMRYSVQAYIESLAIENQEKDMLVQAGYVSAVIDSMQLYIDELKVEKEVQKIPTRYKEELLCILKKRGTLLHKDLAAELRVSDNGLTPIIKKMNSTSVRLINVEEISKYKLYSLTPVANQYVVKRLLNKPKNDKTIDIGSIVRGKSRKSKGEMMWGGFSGFVCHVTPTFEPMSVIKETGNRYMCYSDEGDKKNKKFSLA